MNLEMLGEFAGQPVWLWLAFLAFVALVLWVDLALINNKAEPNLYVFVLIAKETKVT